MCVVVFEKTTWFHLKDGQGAPHAACEEVEVDPVEQDLEQLERDFVSDPRRFYAEKVLQETVAHVVFPLKGSLQGQILKNK